MAEYIEREAVLNIYKKWLPQLTAKEDAGDRRGVETCIAVLEDEPAADVAPVVHGRWSVQRIKSVDSVEISKCSVCNYPASTMWGRTNYCPNCGAKMDENLEKAK